MAVPAARTAGAAGAAVVTVKVGKAVRAKFEPSGQDAMKGAARVKTAFGERGVSKAWGTAVEPLAARMKV